jgi:hypothetical protein
MVAFCQRPLWQISDRSSHSPMHSFSPPPLTSTFRRCSLRSAVVMISTPLGTALGGLVVAHLGAAGTLAASEDLQEVK